MSLRDKHTKKQWVCTYESERLSGKYERARVKQDMVRGAEPQPEYRTSKLWND